MFNIFLSIFLAVCFLLTWASIGTLVAKIDSMAKALDYNFDHIGKTFDKLVTTIQQEPGLHQSLLDVLKENGTALKNLEEQITYLDTRVEKMSELFPTKTELLNAMKKSRKKSVKEIVNENNSES